MKQKAISELLWYSFCKGSQQVALPTDWHGVSTLLENGNYTNAVFTRGTGAISVLGVRALKMLQLKLKIVSGALQFAPWVEMPW